MPALLDAIDQPHVQLLLRLVLGGVLLLAGISKLRDRAAFRAAVAEYDVLPRELEHPFAMLLPWAEAVLGVLLLLGLGTVAVASLAVPLFAAFGIAIGVNLARGRHFDCHCFGAAQQDEIGSTAFLRSLILAFAALTVALGASRFGALESALFGSTADLPSSGEIVPVVFLAAVIFDVLILLPEAVVFRSIIRRAFRQPHAPAPAHNGHRPGETTVELRSAS